MKSIIVIHFLQQVLVYFFDLRIIIIAIAAFHRFDMQMSFKGHLAFLQLICTIYWQKNATVVAQL